MILGGKSRLFMMCFSGLLTIVCILLCSPTFAKQMKIPASVMRECAFEKDFQQCCFSKAIMINGTDSQNANETPNNNQQNENPPSKAIVINGTDSQNANETPNNNQQNENPPSSKYTPNKLHYGSGPIDKYNKYFPTNRPLFDYYESHLIKKCEDVGHWYQSPNNPDYKHCVCDNGGYFDGTDCYCYGWTENGQCACPIGTTKYVFKTGPEKNIDAVNCRSLDHINDWAFSKPDNFGSQGHNSLNDPELTDPVIEEQIRLWEQGIIDKSEVGIWQIRDKGMSTKTITKWKAYGVKAKKGNKTIKFDVVGDSKCINVFANLDATRNRTECVCTITSVSKGSNPKFWAYNPAAHFYWIFGRTFANDTELCLEVCPDKCAQSFSSDDYNLRHILLNWWSPD